MTYSELVNVLGETKMSPEQLAPYLGVGSMTVRRWKKERGQKKLPRIYETVVVEGLYALILEGKLDAGTGCVGQIFANSHSMSFEAAMKSMGVSDAAELENLPQEDRITDALGRIGMSPQRRAEVDRQVPQFERFRKMGAAWSERVTGLVAVIRHEQLSLVDKLVAYGAFFYLIWPFDLIPDHIPVIGYVDDFGILGFALAYYLRKFPHLLGRSNEAEKPGPEPEHA